MFIALTIRTCVCVFAVQFVEDMFERVCLFAALVVLALALASPTKDAMVYTVPLGVAAVSWFLAAVINTSCATEACTVREWAIAANC